MKPILIAGPCVIEPEEIMTEIAEYLCAIKNEYGIDVIFKASFDKANRTSVKSYRGPGLEKGLKILKKVSKRVDK